MHELIAHLSELSGYLPAVLITLGVAALVACALGCTACSPCEEKDELFHREVY